MNQTTDKKSLTAGDDIAYFYANAKDPYMINFHCRQGEINTLELIASQFINDDAIALDIGANIGVTSVSMARLFKSGTVYSFEPSKSNYEFCCQNLKLNGITNCFPYQIAIGNEEGEVDFLHTDFGAGSHVVTNATLSKKYGTYKVRINSIDNILKELDSREIKIDQVDFIKIDVEGFELSVINGMEETIEKYNPYMTPLQKDTTKW